MAVVFTADVQLRNHQNRSHVLPNGRNSRLQNGLDCLLQAAQLAGNGGTLVVNGDLFDDRHKLDIDVIAATVETIGTISQTCSVILSPGNHDQFLADGSIHSLSMFKDRRRVKVVSTNGDAFQDREKTCLLFVLPFSEDHAKVKAFIISAAQSARSAVDTPSFLVLHQAVQSARLSNGVVDTTGLRLADLKADFFEAVILGHYHKPQQVGDLNVYYIGSPYQINAGEANDRKRFLYWEHQQLGSKRVVDMPQFITVKSTEEARQYANDFVTINCPPEEFEAAACPPNAEFLPQREITSEPDAQGLVGFDIVDAVKADLMARGAENLIPTALERLG